MKKLNLILSCLILFFLSSCNSIQNEYESEQSCYESVKEYNYKEIVKVWGEPDIKEDVSILPSNLHDQQNGKNINVTITCVWGKSKVKISGKSCLSLIFDVVEIEGGIILPSKPKGYNSDADCNLITEDNNIEDIATGDLLPTTTPQIEEVKIKLTADEISNVITHIKEDFYMSTKLLNDNKLIADTITSEEEYPYREIVYKNPAGEVYIIKQGDMSNACFAVDEYYFRDGNVYFCYSYHDGASCQSDNPRELRKYFYQNHVIKTIEDKKEVDCKLDCVLNSESAAYKTMAKFNKLQRQ